MSITHLAIKDVMKSYKKVKAVDNVNLEVKKGEFLTILGPSGSGKTTLLKLIAGFEEATEGSITLNRRNITNKKPYERNIGMLFQNYALFPHMTVVENIAYPLHIRNMEKKEIREKVKNMLDLVRLSEYGDRYPNKLSGGQQQRVALARAIVFNPPLLLLDEPLGALDKNLREMMQLEIKHIQEKVGITTISVTHDQEEALTMSDRVCVMNKGRIEQVSTPQGIYQRPDNKFVAEFIGEINLLGGEVVSTEHTKLIIQLFGDSTLSFYAEERADIKENKVYIALRPENLHLVHKASDYENTIQVTICEKIYVGNALKVKTKTSFGEELVVKLPTHLSEELQIGRPICLGWNSADSTVIPFAPRQVISSQGRK
ncbi:ABC transporter ATP-binding protein [Paenibacillus beijingensis]|uniref:Spermidine/putrescine import ATP-binding protein PotA n=1 Tax=Paenibacillus beijingensis TaxID=1126833 RepID=A0A0D5NF85_9BACL|nr:ABC transporter ATP-binding protein [Paenibacillus beijingensis]AJY73800.1 ABC transporter ATP-binding protein [Paenibacillus beijingensis]